MPNQLPPPRPFHWTMKPFESAGTTMRRLPDGRLRLTIKHNIIKGVTPEMLHWWFSHLDEAMQYRGQAYPRYPLWHPLDHIHWEFAGRAPDNSAGPGAKFHIVEAFNRNPKFKVDTVDLIERNDVGGITLVQHRFGVEVFRLAHTFTPVPRGTLYESVMTVGTDHPWIGFVFNRFVRPRLFSDAMARAWLKHNVEEVGNFEVLLPDLYAAHHP